VARPPAHDLDEGPQPAIARASRLRLSAPAIVLFLSFVDVFALLPTVAPYVASLGGGPAFVGLAVGAYSAANLPANVVGGILVDRLGRRRVTMLGLALAALAVAVYPLAATPTAVVVARLLHGAAGGILVPAVFAAAGDRTGARGAGRTMGRMGALIGAAAVVAPAAAGILRQAAGTTAVFLTVSALLGVGFVIAWRFIEDAVVVQPRPKGSGGRVVRDLLREPTLQRAYAATACLTVSVGVLAGFLPGTAETLGARPSVVGLLFTAYALVAGALMLSPLSGRVDREGADRLAGIGLVLLAVALAAGRHAVGRVGGGRLRGVRRRLRPRVPGGDRRHLARRHRRDPGAGVRTVQRGVQRRHRGRATGRRGRRAAGTRPGSVRTRRRGHPRRRGVDPRIGEPPGPRRPRRRRRDGGIRAGRLGCVRRLIAEAGEAAAVHRPLQTGGRFRRPRPSRQPPHPVGAASSARNASSWSTSPRSPTNIGVRWWMPVGTISSSDAWPSDPRPPACSARKASGAAS
jgi:MFS transporter, DHA1 family, multidrug resistance protein